MTPAIWRWFERLETQKQSVLTDVAGLSAAQLRFRPEPTAWSVPDVLDHLIKVEKALLEAVQDQLPQWHSFEIQRSSGCFIHHCRHALTHAGESARFSIDGFARIKSG